MLVSLSSSTRGGRMAQLVVSDRSRLSAVCWTMCHERMWMVIFAFLVIIGTQANDVRTILPSSLVQHGRRASSGLAEANVDFLNLADVQCGEQGFMLARRKRSSDRTNREGLSRSERNFEEKRSLSGVVTNDGEGPSSIVYHVYVPQDGSPSPGSPQNGGRRRRWSSRVFDGVSGFFSRLFRFSQRADTVTNSENVQTFSQQLQGGATRPEIISIGDDDDTSHNGLSAMFSSTNVRKPLLAQRISIFGTGRNTTAYVIDTAQSTLPASAVSTLFAPPGTVGLDRRNATRLATIIRGILNAGRPQQQVDRDTVKIVGGEISERGEFPFMVSLKRGRSNFCGGSILNRRYVLTAAHCVHPGTPDDFVVVAGEHDITAQDQEQEYPVEGVIVHPEYADIPGLSNPNDIALLRLGRDLEWSPFVQPICLPSDPNMQLMRRDATVLGWGRVKEGGPQSSVLRQVVLPILPRFVCYLLYYRFGFSSNHICAGGRLRGGRDACHGDSGGPLVVREQGRFILAGIVSGGKGCGRPLTSGIYMNAARYLKWITTEMYNDHVMHNYLQ